MRALGLLVGDASALRQALAEELARQSGGAPPVVASPSELGDAPGSAAALYLPATPFAGEPPPGEVVAERVSALVGSVEHLVVLSTAAVYSPCMGHPGMVSETDPGTLRARHPLARSWLELEAAACTAAAARPETLLTLLRPTPVPLSGGRDLFSRLLGGRLAPVLAGYDPSLQLLAVEDLARVLLRVVERGRGGLFHVAPAAVVPLRSALRSAGVWPLPLPGWLLRRLRPALGSGLPASSLDYLRYEWTVSGCRLEVELGISAQLSSFRVAGRLCRHRPRRPIQEPEPAFDDFGLDRAYVDRLGRGRLRLLHDLYWRMESAGLEHVPEQGRAVLTGVHRGFVPVDAIMVMHLLARRHRRYVRFLIHPALLRFPFLFDFLRRVGGVVACNENADRILRQDQLLGVFPEGVRGAFALYRDAYRLTRFPRHDFVRIALRNRAPIVPFVTIGSAEVYPMLAHVDWRWWKRTTRWPCLPVVATPIPLPAKLHTRFLPPLAVAEEHGPEAAADPSTVESISLEVQARLAATLQEMRRRRRSVFFGSVFDP